MLQIVGKASASVRQVRFDYLNLAVYNEMHIVIITIMRLISTITMGKEGSTFTVTEA